MSPSRRGLGGLWGAGGGSEGQDVFVFAHSAAPTSNFSQRWRPCVHLSEDAATKRVLVPASGFYLNRLILDPLEPGHGGVSG